MQPALELLTGQAYTDWRAHWAPREAGVVLTEMAGFPAESNPLLSCCSYSKRGGELLAQVRDLALPDLSSPFSSRQE